MKFKKLKNYLSWMNNINNSPNNNSQRKIEDPHILYSFDRKDCTITELLTVFSIDLSDPTY